jgi:hypothetical protein
MRALPPTNLAAGLYFRLRLPVCASAFAWWCLLRWNCPRVSARRESLYQSAPKTIKGQSDCGVKTAKIRAELFCPRARHADRSRSRNARRGFLNRRTLMRFRETIEQHFRRALVSKPFRSCKRGTPHEMGAGAIEEAAIESVSTESRDADLAITHTSRRRRAIHPRRGFETPSSTKSARPKARPKALPKAVREERYKGPPGAAGPRR